MIAVEPWMHFLDGTDVHNRRSVNSQEFVRIKFAFELVERFTNLMRPHAYSVCCKGQPQTREINLR